MTDAARARLWQLVAAGCAGAAGLLIAEFLARAIWLDTTVVDSVKEVRRDLGRVRSDLGVVSERLRATEQRTIYLRQAIMGPPAEPEE